MSPSLSPPALPSLADLGLGLPCEEPFTRTQAADHGITPARLKRLIAGGAVRRVLHSVYVAAEVPDSIDLRCRALSSVLAPDSFICDRTAAWIYTGSSALAPNEHLAMPSISCFRPSGKRRLTGPILVSGERAIRDGDLRELNGLVLTTELRTALDLGRLEPTMDMRVWGMSNLLATGAFDKEALLARVPEFKGARGVVGLRIAVPRVDARLESMGEAALYNRWLDIGLPPPELQISLQVDGVEVARLDMGLREWLFAAEYDGERFHSSDADVEHDEDRRAWIERDFRYLIEVFTRANVFGRSQDVDVRLRRAALAARASAGSRSFIL
ncbi:MAG: type IV toxin-antitoxin system AbiEi family antitoxin domain-containing protein [Nocardioides sp.]|uniref:hypothetical protein n=1 Tax=Nocardioides sp. TaxID=35761 RepID=UPI0039E224F9